MQDGNYIKINRSILEWEWYQNINTKVLFLHMLLKANWKEGKFEGVLVERGSFVSSYPRLAEECNLTVNELRTALKHLTDTVELTVNSHGKFSVFTVNNYNVYQDINSQLTDEPQSVNRQSTVNPQTINRRLTGESHSINRRLTTIEEGKKEKKEEGKKGKREEGKKNNLGSAYFPNDDKLNQSFSDYVLMRKEIKKPMTDKAIELAIKKIVKLSTSDSSGAMDNDIAIQILDQSIMNSWQGLFPLKSDKPQNEKKGIDWDNI